MPNSRAKGVAFERQVAVEFERAGYHVRGLESGGDHFCVRREEARQFIEPPVLLHVECKRAERLKLPEWLRQVKRDATPGTVPLLVFKQSRQPAYVVMPFDLFLGIMGGSPSGDD